MENTTFYMGSQEKNKVQLIAKTYYQFQNNFIFFRFSIKSFAIKMNVGNDLLNTEIP